jgi:hypothetical protein
MKSMKQVIIFLWILTGTNLAVAQEVSPEVPRKNTVKLDLTANFWYNNVFGISYERITRPNQSFAVSFGYQEFPRTSRLGQNIVVKNNRDKNGYKFGGEYRFYLKKENKYPAPRGIYIGPYFTRHSFSNEREIEVDHNGTPEEVLLNSKFTIFNVGFQLGYQFVFNDRWTIDLILVGPSVSNYRYTLNLDGDFTFDKEDIQNEIILDLLDRFPMLDEVISEKEATRNGKLDTWAYGYRYQLHVGYRFGR